MNTKTGVALLSALSVASGAYAPDEIISLPGWSGNLPSKQYSGYLNVSSTSHLHYWLVESESNPATDPVVLWFNGGPGCSSLDGFFYEHGPFEIESDYTTLSLRPYRWSSMVNMLYIESPVGVGFSYSSTNSYKLDDDKTARDNLAAVEAFYASFPEYKQNKFYITGESYAGVYVPTLAEAILNDDLAGTYTGAKLTGIAVGNGCTGTEIGICGSGPQGTFYEWEYLLGTGFIDQDLKNQINDTCDWDAAAQNTAGALSANCVSLLNEASAQIGHVDMYNIYGDCVSDMCAAKGNGRKSKIPEREPYEVSDGTHTRRLERITPHGPDACIDSGAATGYLNQPSVMEAIHVRDPGFCWAVCNTADGWAYKSTRTNLPLNTYPQLVSSIDVLIYNGDWDACVPYTDNEAWTQNMGYTVKNPWHAWKYTSSEGHSNQVAGYAVNYDVSKEGSGKFEFITIRGGRHEVPESAPAQSMEMLKRMINGEEF
jgi:carboxypeptidase C (cathepsin A)